VFKVFKARKGLKVQPVLKELKGCKELKGFKAHRVQPALKGLKV
jgi:hypothetical protein